MKKLSLLPRILIVSFAFFWIPRLFLLSKAGFWTALTSGPLSPSLLLRCLTTDLAFFCYTLVPVLLIARCLGTRSRTALGLQGFYLFILITSSIFELFFIEEFTSRYNFIAVDYLVYSQEVFRNIAESYPVVWILSSMAGLWALVTYWTLKKTAASSSNSKPSWALVLFFVAVAGLLHWQGTEERLVANLRPEEQELAKNGTYALFAAYRNNSLDYVKFYESLDEQKAQGIVRAARESRKTAPGAFTEKQIWKTARPPNVNVILVLMESLSARFMASYHGQPDLTPNLDRLTNESLWFANLYATGTRTVRGIEALMLSLPPTPGQSIVRRPKNDGLYNLGSEFQDRGYKTQFIYGGRGLFDNMGPVFSDNGFEVVDRSNFSGGEVTFETAWGVSDEDLLKKSLQEADRAFATKTPFLQFILTTSNHRPYLYPEGKVAKLPGTGREGAIQYSDYAIGEFLKAARSKEWFKSTIFVFVADHNASVAGGSRVVPYDYLIPAMFYAPEMLKAQRFDNLASQIDLAPTLIRLLGWEYRRNQFFGSSVISEPSHEAFLGTYQIVGRLHRNQLVLLEPRKRSVRYHVLPNLQLDMGSQKRPDSSDPDFIETVADYSLASALFVSGRLKK